MPLIQVAETAPVTVPAAIVTTPVAQAAYVAPVYPRKQDRN
jgi:hypothetical protein